MAILEHIKKEYREAVRKKCFEKGCALKLDRLDSKELVVLKGEKIVKDQPMCDFIVLNSFQKPKRVLAVGVVELKSKTVEARQVVKKMENGLKVVLRALEKYAAPGTAHKIYIIVLAKRWGKADYNVIRNRKIQFRGKKYYILPKRCGTSFADIAAKY